METLDAVGRVSEEVVAHIRRSWSDDGGVPVRILSTVLSAAGPEYGISSIMFRLPVMHAPEKIANPAFRDGHRAHCAPLVRGQVRAPVLEEWDPVTGTEMVVLRTDGDIVSVQILVGQR
jgi:hypothetical protein